MACPPQGSGTHHPVAFSWAGVSRGLCDPSTVNPSAATPAQGSTSAQREEALPLPPPPPSKPPPPPTGRTELGAQAACGRARHPVVGLSVDGAGESPERPVHKTPPLFQGDSGGPLVCEFNHTWLQVGVVSWGRGCTYPMFPAVYARVSYFSEWIHYHVEHTPLPLQPLPTRSSMLAAILSAPVTMLAVLLTL